MTFVENIIFLKISIYSKKTFSFLKICNSSTLDFSEKIFRKNYECMREFKNYIMSSKFLSLFIFGLHCNFT